MKTYDNRKTPKEKANQRYNSTKINECNVVVSVRNINNLSLVSYKVNICDKEIIKLWILSSLKEFNNFLGTT